MKNQLLFFVLCLFILIAGCSQNDIDGLTYTIKSGSSFGMCVGTCYKELSIDKSEAILRVAERGRQGNDEPKVHAIREVSEDEWNEIMALVDENTISNLPEVIGCPDCADGGAEWVEFQSPGFAKKVTFEYGSPPVEIEELVFQLREKREELFIPPEDSTSD